MGEPFNMPIMSKMKTLGIVTWEPTKEHRAKAKDNHGQSLEMLASRGGLCWTELYCILFNKGLFDVVHNDKSNEQARQYIVDELKFHFQATP